VALNEKQEKFAQSYILHRNATEAAKAAGYSSRSANNQGYRLLQIEEVTQRIAELENELETNVDVINEIENQYEFAKANGHTNSALKALELLSRVRGTSGDITFNMDEENLETAIVSYLNILGEEQVLNLISKCNFITEEDEEDAKEMEGV
jgi:phosphoenolpyruvate synthase/pyruvate phosphate dikinase|tara:strand:- start:319 stop:771 length:453 start_codon:yes stop_codon:yes gene_type:complete